MKTNCRCRSQNQLFTAVQQYTAESESDAALYNSLEEAFNIRDQRSVDIGLKVCIPRARYKIYEMLPEVSQHTVITYLIRGCVRHKNVSVENRFVNDSLCPAPDLVSCCKSVCHRAMRAHLSDDTPHPIPSVNKVAMIRVYQEML